MLAVALLASLSATAAQPTPPVVAVFDEPSFPVSWATTPVAAICRALDGAGLAYERVSADALADPGVLNPSRYDVVVLPYGSRFPLAARETFQGYLRAGGNFISLGGHAFNDLMERSAGGWETHADRVTRERATEGLAAANVLSDLGPDAWTVVGSARHSVVYGDATGRIRVEADHPGGCIAQRVDLDPGRQYVMRVTTRSEGVSPGGYAYAALYERDSAGSIVQWFDCETLPLTAGPRTRTHVFRPHEAAATREVQLGVYNGAGAAVFDEVVVAPWPEKTIMNSADGRPGDGLGLAPEQLGLFDPAFPLRRASRVVRADCPWAPDVEAESLEPLGGWAATGLTFVNGARWTPVLTTTDRYGRPTGAALSVLWHYGDYYAGSSWAYSGIESDLFALLGESLASSTLVACIERLRWGVFIRPVRCEFDSYAPGERPRCEVVVQNNAFTERSVTLRLAVAGWSESREITVPARGQVGSDFDLPVAAEPGLCRLEVTAEVGGREFDRVEGGYVAVPPGEWGGGRRVVFADNGFTLDGQPRVLLGSDSYANVFHNHGEGPLTWLRDLTLSRDFGLDVYENLQFSAAPSWRYSAAQLRQMDGIIRLAQELGLVYMAGWVIGGDTWASDEELEGQRQRVVDVARRYRDARGLIHYINGDLQFSVEPGDGMDERFRAWLLARYGGEAALRDAWGERLEWPLAEIPYPVPNTGLWADVRARDAALFGVLETRRWLATLGDAIRSEYGGQPITAEYYRLPVAGADLPQTIEPLDVANIAVFGPQLNRDLADGALALAFADSRLRGKGLNIGEFGVKTHPAWAEGSGAFDYHMARTEEQQREVFVGIVHLGLGMGVSKFQNWCLKDSDEGVFPWGIFYQNDGVPKPVAYTYRSLALLTRHVVPRWEPPGLAVLLPDCSRIGGASDKVWRACLTAFEGLLRAQVQFAVVPDTDIPDLPPGVRAMWWPAPFCCTDAAREKVLDFVRSGGALYLSGDLSWDERRQRTRQLQFEELVGLAVVRHGGSPDNSAVKDAVEGPLGLLAPWHGLVPTSAEVLARAADGTPLLTRNRVGEGTVVYLNSGGELSHDADALAPAYRAALDALAISGLGVPGDGLYVFDMALHGGTARVLVNVGQEPVATEFSFGGLDVAATVNARSPALIALDAQGAPLAMSVSGRIAVRGGPEVHAPVGACVIWLPVESYALAIGPYGPGEVTIVDQRIPDGLVRELGEPVGGGWRAYDTVPLGTAGAARLPADDVEATLISLVARGEDLAAARTAAWR